MGLEFYSQEKDRKIRYTDQLKIAIVGLCDVDPQTRLTSKKVYDWLRPHEADIVNLHKFTTDMPPYNLKVRHTNQEEYLRGELDSKFSPIQIMSPKNKSSG